MTNNTSTNSKYSFWKLINEFQIEIPMIQRDYAQGRDNTKVAEIRKNFVNTLYDALVNKNELDFDFVYGKEEKSKTYSNLLPLDGQQRLTTLFLLHWYLDRKENKGNLNLEILDKFTYKTRISSRDFCRDLVEKGIDFCDIDVTVSETIKDRSWYFLSWGKDPTISSMLVMLDAIHEKFKNCPPLFDYLTGENCPVTFQFLPLEDFGLTDNLYIKMNARGKSLTDFENFKAKFEQFLDKTYKEKKDIFKVNIDGKWADFFWKHKEKNLIDKPFMAFFSFFTEMLYYKQVNQNSILKAIEIDFDHVKVVYSSKDNVDFLFMSLDLLHEIENTDSFFDQLFSGQKSVGKVCLFDAQTNLFKRCVTNISFAIREKVLLFSIFKYLNLRDTKDVDDDLKDLMRVIRNLLYRVRQAKRIEYVSNLRYSNIPEQIKAIEEKIISPENVYSILSQGIKINGFTEQSVNHEIAKAIEIVKSDEKKLYLFSLEDDFLLQGTLYNFDVSVEEDTLKKQTEVFQNIWQNNVDNHLIIRSLLTISTFGVRIGWGQLGEKVYFGYGKNWNRILTNPSDDFKEMLSNFFDKVINYSSTNENLVGTLNYLISSWLEENTLRNWRYYFIKYSKFSETTNPIFMWQYGRHKTNFEIRRLTKLIASSHHVNPFALTIADKLDDTICNTVWNSYTNGNYYSALVLNDGTNFYCKEEHWSIYPSEDKIEKFNGELTMNFKLELLSDEDDKEYYRLKEFDDRDRVELAVDFIEQLFE